MVHRHKTSHIQSTISPGTCVHERTRCQESRQSTMGAAGAAWLRAAQPPPAPCDLHAPTAPYPPRPVAVPTLWPT
eukprot:9492966-Pyramimonas_sp.AAC.1